MLPERARGARAPEPILVGHSDGASIALIHAARPAGHRARPAGAARLRRGDDPARDPARHARLRDGRPARAHGPPPRRPRRRLLGLVRRLARPRVPRLEHRGRRGAGQLPDAAPPGRRRPLRHARPARPHRRASARRVERLHVPGGHSPHLEQPDPVVARIADFAAACPDPITFDDPRRLECRRCSSAAMAWRHIQGDRGRQPASEEDRDSVPSGDGRRRPRGRGRPRAFADWSKTDAEARARVLRGRRAHRGARQRRRRRSPPSRASRSPRRAARSRHLAHGVRYYAEAATKVTGTYQELRHVRPRLRQGDPPPDGRVRGDPPTTSRSRCSARRSRRACRWATPSSPSRPPRRRSPTLEVARIFAEAGVPDGVLNVVTGRGAVIGDALVGHPDVRRVAFTGSTDSAASGGDRRPRAEAACRWSSAAWTR